MRQSTIRRVVAGIVVVALVTLGAAVLLAGPASDADPVWAGAALGTERGTSTEVVIDAVTPRDPERIAAARLGDANPSFEITQQGGLTVYRDADVTVRVRDVSPVVLAGQRNAAAGALPSAADARKTADDLVRAFGLDPAQWSVKETGTASFRAVRYDVRAELPVFSTEGVETPFLSVAVDAGGVRSFSVTLARLAPRQVAIRSEREAFERLDRDGRYESVRLVLVDTGIGRIRPHWEFKDTAGKLVPVAAVLTG